MIYLWVRDYICVYRKEELQSMELKNRLKSIIYNTGLYVTYDVFLTKRLRKKMLRDGLKPIGDFDLDSLKTSDTLFILGSGTSVMNLSVENWEEVKKHDSLGFNGWPLHDFVPTYYCIETSKNPTVAKIRIGHLNARSQDYKNTPVFIQYPHMLSANEDYSSLVFPKDNIYYNDPYMPFTTNFRVMKRLISRWFKSKPKDLNGLIHYSASLSYLLGMGYRMGYKKMVLLGIDLNNSGYFFEHDNASKRAKEFLPVYEKEIRKKNNLTKESMHATVSKKITAQYGCLPIDVYVEQFNKELLTKGVQLYIGNSESKLYPMLPLFEFK